ncbi:MAG: prolyl oligopeptidase family serine peptidase [Planctomycetaceae bacterium]|nr:prolyl oligopeptidase family serine peptidase [Planctomycetaceae bacterium]
MPQQRSVEFVTPDGIRMDYLLYRPDGYQPDQNWPLMIFLHGAGERGNHLEIVKSHGPPKLIEQGKTFPFLVVSPQCESGKWWRPDAVCHLLDGVLQTNAIDPKRVYLTGLSMGGYGTWSTVARSADRFAAAAPICGGGDPARVNQHRHVPTWAFHGAKDPTVPLANTERMVAALKAVDGLIECTVYPELAHDAWTETYENRELYEWMLKQSK